MIEYIASKQGVDPMTVLNKLREINGLDALPPSPAIEQVQNELTPKQQQLLYKFKTPERSSRGLSNMSSYAPNLSPKDTVKSSKELERSLISHPQLLQVLLKQKVRGTYKLITSTARQRV